MKKGDNHPENELVELGRQVRAGAYVKRNSFFFGLFATGLLCLYLGYVLSSMLPGASGVAPQGAAGQNQASPALSQELASRLARLEQATIGSPKDAALWDQLGHAYFEARQYQKGISAYETARSLGRLSSDALSHLGVMYGSEHMHDKALAALKEAVELDPGNGEALFYLGGVYYYDLNDRKQGLETWKKLLAINPDLQMEDGRTLREWVESLPE